MGDRKILFTQIDSLLKKADQVIKRSNSRMQDFFSDDTDEAEEQEEQEGLDG